MLLASAASLTSLMYALFGFGNGAATMMVSGRTHGPDGTLGRMTEYEVNTTRGTLIRSKAYRGAYAFRLTEAMAEIDNAVSHHSDVDAAISPGGGYLFDVERLHVMSVFHGNPSPVDRQIWTYLRADGVDEGLSLPLIQT